MQSRPLLPRVFRLLRISAPLWLALVRSFFHTQATGIRHYFTVIEREECDLPSSKCSRLNEGDHNNSDGSSITAEEHMDEREFTSHVTTTQQILDRTPDMCVCVCVFMCVYTYVCMCVCIAVF